MLSKMPAFWPTVIVIGVAFTVVLIGVLASLSLNEPFSVTWTAFTTLTVPPFSVLTEALTVKSPGLSNPNPIPLIF